MYFQRELFEINFFLYSLYFLLSIVLAFLGITRCFIPAAASLQRYHYSFSLVGNMTFLLLCLSTLFSSVASYTPVTAIKACPAKLNCRNLSVKFSA